jgi:hypothetical protein
MAANGISTDPIKANRQSTKLGIASTKRAQMNLITQGRYPKETYDLTQLPKTYNPADNNDPVDTNPNAGGLLPGRPWA